MPEGGKLVSQTCIIKRNNQAMTQWLIHWENSNIDEARWEESATIQK